MSHYSLSPDDRTISCTLELEDELVVNDFEALREKHLSEGATGWTTDRDKHPGEGAPIITKRRII